jgi:hypothetical protein
MNKYTLKVITGPTCYLQVIHADYFEIKSGAYIFHRLSTDEEDSIVVGATPIDLTIISEVERNVGHQ